jgi:secreted trypsin-like serine protease
VSLFQVKACGESFIENNVLSGHGIMTQIANGITAIPHSWPSISKIVINMQNGYIGHCGGTLIDNRTVLSAAQ